MALTADMTLEAEAAMVFENDDLPELIRAPSCDNQMSINGIAEEELVTNSKDPLNDYEESVSSSDNVQNVAPPVDYSAINALSGIQNEIDLEMKSNEIARRKFKDYMCEGIEAFQTDNIKLAFEHHSNAWKLFIAKGAKTLNLLEEAILEMKFTIAFVAVHRKTIKSEELAKSIFYEILGLPNSCYSSLAHYGLALSHYFVRRLPEAVQHLEDAQLSLKSDNPIPIKWFGTQEKIPVSRLEVLKESFGELIKKCNNPVPDAICRYKQCKDKSEIYIDEVDFQGFVIARCSEKCCIHYHPTCWKNFKVENKKRSDKDIIEFACQTPDCVGSFSEIHIYDADNNLRKIIQGNISQPQTPAPTVKQKTPSKVLAEQKKKVSPQKKGKIRKENSEESTSTATAQGEVKNSTAAIEEVKAPILHTEPIMFPDVTNSDGKFIQKKSESNKDSTPKSNAKKKKRSGKKEKELLPISVNLTDHEGRIGKLQHFKAVAEEGMSGFPLISSERTFENTDEPFAVPYDLNDDYKNLEILFQNASRVSRVYNYGGFSSEELKPEGNNCTAMAETTFSEHNGYWDESQQGVANGQEEELVKAVKRITCLEAQLQIITDKYLKVTNVFQIEKREMMTEREEHRQKIKELETREELSRRQIMQMSAFVQRSEVELTKTVKEKKQFEQKIDALENANRILRAEIDALQLQLRKANEENEKLQFTNTALKEEIGVGSIKQLQEALRAMELNYGELLNEKKELEVTLRHLTNVMSTPSHISPIEPPRPINRMLMQTLPVNPLLINKLPQNRMAMTSEINNVAISARTSWQTNDEFSLAVKGPVRCLPTMSAVVNQVPDASQNHHEQLATANAQINKSSGSLVFNTTGAIPKQRAGALATIPVPAAQQPKRKGTMGLDKFEELPSLWLSGEQRKEIVEEYNETCVICMEDHPHNSVVTLQCNHQFHLKCITIWFQSQSTCPFCRRQVGLPDFPPLK